MSRRVIAFYCGLVLVFGLLFTRVASLSGGDALAQAAEVQSSRTINVLWTAPNCADSTKSALCRKMKF